MDRMSDRQLYSWALAAALAPGLFLAPAVPWLGVVLGVVVAGIFLWGLRHLGGKTGMTALGRAVLLRHTAGERSAQLRVGTSPAASVRVG